MMKNLRFLFVNLVMCLTLAFPLVAIASPFGTRDESLLVDMYANPQNYLFVGADNFGVTYYISKDSLDIQQYDPPNYIIAFTGVTHKSQDPMTTERAYRDDYVTKYKYNSQTKRMYREQYSPDKGNYWEFIDTALPLTIQPRESGGAHRGRIRKITKGEIAFFLAYETSFFKNPVTDVAKHFANGRPDFFRSK